MKITHGDMCGAEWSGLKIEHCPACHETFSGTTSGDRHRVGSHGVTDGPDRRRCLTVDEMRSLTRKGGVPFYQETVNSYGTTVWSQYDAREKAPRLALGRDSEPLAA